MSLAKFYNRDQTPDGEKLHWGRAGRDGLPFRGEHAPMYTDEEFEAKVHKVADPKADTFDLSDPAEKKRYLDVVDGIVNGWFQGLFIQRWRSKKNERRVFVHVEWVEYFLEDGHRTRFLSPGQMELTRGQPSGSGFA